MTLSELIDRLERLIKDKPLQDPLHDILSELSELKFKLNDELNYLPPTNTAERLRKMR